VAADDAGGGAAVGEGVRDAAGRDVAVGGGVGDAATSGVGGIVGEAAGSVVGMSWGVGGSVGVAAGAAGLPQAIITNTATRPKLSFIPFNRLIPFPRSYRFQ
jgi:hypothetical protein